MKRYLFMVLLFMFAFSFWENYDRPVWDRDNRDQFQLERGFDWDNCENS